VVAHVVGVVAHVVVGSGHWFQVVGVDLLIFLRWGAVVSWGRAGDQVKDVVGDLVVLLL